jgi:proline iminopeptidase
MKTEIPDWIAWILVPLLCLPLLLAAAATEQGKPSEAKLAEEGYLSGEDGVRLFYRKLGAGRNVVVFLHGGPGLSIEDGGYFMDPLAKGHTLIMFGQRGGGRSDIVDDPSRLTVSHFVADLEAVRQRFRIERMALVGLSWGSGLAAFYTDAHPQRVSRIVFLDPMPITRGYAEQRGQKLNSLYTARERARLTDLDDELKIASGDQVQAICREQSRISDRLYLFHPETDDLGKWDTCATSPAGIRNGSVVFSGVFKPLGDFDLRPMVSKLKVPVLVIEGEKTNVPLDGTEEWAKTPQDARMLLIPDAGHGAFVDEPQAVVYAIRVFLNGEWPKMARRLVDAKRSRTLRGSSPSIANHPGKRNLESASPPQFDRSPILF